MNDKMQQFVRTYGSVGVTVHLSIAALSWAGFAIAINSGMLMQDLLPEWVADAGTAATAWAAMKIVSPIRWLATAAITPVLVGVFKKLKGRTPLASLGAEKPITEK